MNSALCGKDCGHWTGVTCYGQGMVTIDNKKAPATLRVQSVPSGRFEVRDGDRLLGSSQNEMMAVWSAVGAAEQMAKSGQAARVVVGPDGNDSEAFVTSPFPPA
jgi:hypothetical protein